MSLAVGPHNGKVTHVIAGINSSPDDVAKGTNQHLRVFASEPIRAKSLSSPNGSSSVKLRAFPESKIAEVSRTALFSSPDKSMYQRLLRVSGPIGVAASALGKEAQVAVFDVKAPRPRPRGLLELAEDAEAVDVIRTGPDEFQLAYCDKYELYTVRIGSEANSDPELVFSMPDDHGERPKFRCLRYLTPEFVLAVSNLPKRNTGVLIQGLRLPSPGHEKARLAVTARIPGNTSATALAVTQLSPLSLALDPMADSQFVLAVAASDSSISLYTVNHQTSPALNILSHLHPFYTLKNVHGNEQISGLAFSTFTTPKTHIRPQHVKLASTSLQKTVVVHNIPLKKYVDRSQTRDKRGPARPARYVVALRSRGPSNQPLIATLTVIVLLLAIVAQSVKEMYGVGQPLIFSQRFLPSWHGSLRNPDFQPSLLFENRLASRLQDNKILGAGQKLVLLEAPVHANGGKVAKKPQVHVDVHDSNAHRNAKTWDQLVADEQHAWKERLREAGAWTQHMGESVFKGVLFGELAGMVGRAVAG